MPNNLQQYSLSSNSSARRVAGEASRTPTACVGCRERKIKCSGHQPCRFCLRRNLQCVMPESGKRKLYSVKYVNELERRVALQSGISSSRTHTTAEDDTLNEGSVDDVGDIRDTAAPQAVPNGLSPIETDTVMSSSQNFGSHIKAMPTRPDSHSNRLPKLKLSKSADNAYGLAIPPLHQHERSYVSNWPTEEEAQDLLDTVLSSVGKLQHLFDPRTFADQLALRYTQDSSERRDDQDLWHVEMLMVFAIGKLLKGNIDSDTHLPGEGLFMEAMNNLSNLTHLYAAGTLGIEVMVLMAFYLQCADLKEDAYIYAGMAVRIALLMGLHTDTTAPMTRSEKTHRNRLWWAVYMQERRLSAATGMPLSIHDESIRAALPTDTPGFYPSAPIKINIEIAKVTGQILQTIYGQVEQTEHTFVTGVRQILSSLYQISQNMPSDLLVDFSKPKLDVTRSGATLYLMLYQAMILATRPVLLHLARERFNGPNDAVLRSKPLQKLTETCVDAARRSLHILCALQRQNLIANFGFFDLDALFSVAFIFILAESIRTSQQQNSTIREIQFCLNVFHHLKEHGNRAASNRESDIMQIYDHLGLSKDLLSSENDTLAANNTGVSTEAIANMSSVTSPRDAVISNTNSNNVEPINNQYHLGFPETSLATEMANLDHPLHWVEDPTANEFVINDETRVLYSFYYNDGLTLSGTVETDWEVLERQLFPPP